MTPIQEFLEQEKYEYYPDICKLWLEKEKEFAKQCFEAGRKDHWNNNDSQSRIWEPDYIYDYENFEDFYKSLEK